MTNNKEFTRDAWRVRNAVANRRSLDVGKVSVDARGGGVYAYFNGVQFFMLRDGYWRVDTWGSRDRELVMYVNACLSGAYALVRMFYSENGRRVGVVGREGVLADNVQWFNNSVLERGARP